MDHDKKIKELMHKISRTVAETLAASGEIRDFIKQIELLGYRLDLILTAGISADPEKVGDFEEILSEKDESDSQEEGFEISDAHIESSLNKLDHDFLSSLRIRIEPFDKKD